MEEVDDDVQSLTKIVDSCGEKNEDNQTQKTNCEPSTSRTEVGNSEWVNEAEADSDEKTVKEISESKKLGKVKKRKYRLRCRSDDVSEEEISPIQLDNTDSKDNEVNSNPTDVRKTSISVNPSAGVSKCKKSSAKHKKSSDNKSLSTSVSHPTMSQDTLSQETAGSLTEPSEIVATCENQTESNNDSDSSKLTDSSSSSISSSSSSLHSRNFEDDDDDGHILTDEEEWLKSDIRPLGPPTWIAVKEIARRQYGCPSRHWQFKVRGSHGLVQRLEKQYTLDAHEGCVNSLHFNQKGTLLASGSDDLDINIWDFQSSDSEPYISYHSGHRSNIFQSKFMPNSSDLTLVSCARDGQVRVGYLSSTGTCRDTKKLAQHRGSAHKIALDSCGSNTTFFSCAEDGVVMEFDLRDSNPSRKLVTVKGERGKIALYSIDVSPRQPFEFAVSGRNEWARVYDRRMLNSEHPEIVAKYCPDHLISAHGKANITCLVYNNDGRELLCSYNDDDIYLFDATHSSGDDFKRKFKGHRNNATVKGVNFYGPNSEFIVSGSDCGNIYLWDKASSQVIRFMQGDDGGVVNVLEPHPNLPMLATSGLDNNIKIWGPTGDTELDEEKLTALMLGNHKERHDDTADAGIDSQLLWFLMRTLRSRRQMEGDVSSDRSPSGSSDSDGEGGRSRADCLPS